MYGFGQDIFAEPTGDIFNGVFGNDEQGLPPGAIAKWLTSYGISEANFMRSAIPPGAHSTIQQVKGSGFAGAGSATAPGLETTDVLTATGTVPTCTLDGVLTFPGPDCWDIYVHRDGVPWAYWAGVNAGKTYESDSSGNGHVLLNIGGGTTITQRTNGTGTNLVNELGYSIADGGMMFADPAGELLLPAGTLFTYGYEPSQELVYADGGTELLTNDSLESLYSLVI